MHESGLRSLIRTQLHRVSECKIIIILTVYIIVLLLLQYT